MGRIREINLLDGQLKSLFGFLQDTGCTRCDKSSHAVINIRIDEHPRVWLLCVLLYGDDQAGQGRKDTGLVRILRLQDLCSYS